MIIKMEINYYKEEDIMHIVLSEGPELGSVEIDPNITLELDENREIIGIEILHATQFLRDLNRTREIHEYRT